MGAYLNEALGVSCGLEHGGAFAQSVADGFLDIDMGTGFECSDDGKGVPVVWGGDDTDLGFFLGQHLAIVAVVFRLIAGELGYFC